jgi:DNA invertase Pin-like site-specific DNA recombinase
LLGQAAQRDELMALEGESVMRLPPWVQFEPLVSHILGALAEFERELIKERAREGIKAAKSRGQKMGRRYAMNQEQIRQARRLMDEGNSASYVSGIFKVSQATLFNSFQRLKDDDIPGRKEEGRDARTVDMCDGKTDKDR